MGKILRRYLTVNFIVPFLYTFIFIITFLLIFQLLKIVKLVVSKGIPISTVFELILFVCVSFLPLATPLALLFACIYSMGKLSSDSEYIAIRTFGVSKWKLFLPYLIVSLSVSACLFEMSSTVIPYCKRQFKQIISFISSKGVLSDVRPGIFYGEIPNVTILANEVDKEKKILKKVYIKSGHAFHNDYTVIFAEKGQMIKNSEKMFTVQNLSFHLTNGTLIKGSIENENIRKVRFEKYILPIDISKFQSLGHTKNSMRTNKMLKKHLKKVKGKDKKEEFKAKIELLSRFNFPILCILFTLMGFSLGVQKTRGKNKGSISKTLTILSSYFALYFSFVAIAKSKSFIPPEFAVFFPTVILAIVALFFFQKLDWKS